MDWKSLISAKRYGMEKYHEVREENRSEFQRDYDRLVFSAPFRRLQNKTQVFPLPGSVFVHNRLTHSLEVSCVGRSLGNDSARTLIAKHPELADTFLPEIGNIVSAACLAHDLGNPPFGHSGERAISTYFSEGNGMKLQGELTENQWQDLIHFEGNANAFRLLTHQFHGRRKGGFAMTTLRCGYCKIPVLIVSGRREVEIRFFTTEEETFQLHSDDLELKKLNDSPTKYARHPLVYLVEAADDICYQLMDIEDAHKLKILTTEETKELFLNFFPDARKERMYKTFDFVNDTNEQIAYLRSSVIGLLIRECTRVFVENEDKILAGTFEGTLIKSVEHQAATAYTMCGKTAKDKIYRSQVVLDVELAGFRVISTLLDLMVDAVQNPSKAYSQLLINRVSEQYDFKSAYNLREDTGGIGLYFGYDGCICSRFVP